jgi:putative MFS transporter
VIAARLDRLPTARHIWYLVEADGKFPRPPRDIFGTLFAHRQDPVSLIVFGVLVTLCDNWLSFVFHNHRSELFPTRIRSRAIGFVCSRSRLSAALSGLAIAFFLDIGEVAGVFSFIAFAMVIVVITISDFGPRSRGLALEAISR